MTRYRIFRPRNPVQQQQQHGQAGDEVPGLQLVRSEDSSDSSFPRELIPTNDYYPRARVFQSSKWTTLDVHSCKSILCDSCRRPGPTFLTVPVVPASTIRCLPYRWWENNYDETKASTLLSGAIAEYKKRFAADYCEEQVEAPYDEAMFLYGEADGLDSRRLSNKRHLIHYVARSPPHVHKSLPQ
jgi:hypothetical protein